MALGYQLCTLSGDTPLLTPQLLSNSGRQKECGGIEDSRVLSISFNPRD